MIIVSKTTQKQTITAIKSGDFSEVDKIKESAKRTLEKCSMPFLLVLSR